MNARPSELVAALDDYIEMLERELDYQQCRYGEGIFDGERPTQRHFDNARERIKFARPKNPSAPFVSSVLSV